MNLRLTKKHYLQAALAFSLVIAVGGLLVYIALSDTAINDFAILPSQSAQLTPTPQAIVQSQPTANPEIAVNITRTDYEQALTRWRSSGIQEYEITVHTYVPQNGDILTLHVSNSSKTILAKDPIVKRFFEVRQQDSDQRSQLTVEAMLALAESWLDKRKYPQDLPVPDGGHWTPIYHIEFDSEYGYPTSLNSYPEYLRDGPGNIQVDFEMSVENFKILKKSAPAKP